MKIEFHKNQISEKAEHDWPNDYRSINSMRQFSNQKPSNLVLKSQNKCKLSSKQ